MAVWFYCTIDFSLRVDFEDSRKGWILIFFGISHFMFSPPPHTLSKHIVAVEATIDKQSPHGKVLFKSGGLFSEWALLVYINIFRNVITSFN